MQTNERHHVRRRENAIGYFAFRRIPRRPFLFSSLIAQLPAENQIKLAVAAKILAHKRFHIKAHYTVFSNIWTQLLKLVQENF